MFNKKNSLFGLILVAGGLLLIVNRARFLPSETPTNESPTVTVEQSPSPATDTVFIPVTVTFNYGGARTEEKISRQVVAGSSVLTVLEKVKPGQVQIKDYDFGKLVEGIEGVTNGDQNRYWLYKVNDQEASDSASLHILQPNDVVSWEFKAYEP